MQGHCNWAACIGRVIIGLFFIVMGVLNFMYPDAHLSVLVAHKIPAADMVFDAWIVISIILGLLLLIGRGLKTASWILIVLTLIELPVFMNFWDFTGPAKTVMLFHFINGILVIGALLLIAGSKKHCE